VLCDHLWGADWRAAREIQVLNPCDSIPVQGQCRFVSCFLTTKNTKGAKNEKRFDSMAIGGFNHESESYL
jgi:hypothetical protein